MSRSRNYSLAAVLGSAGVLVALLLATVFLVLYGVFHLRLIDLQERQTTLLDWEEAQSVADVLVGSGRWRVTDSLAPCGDASPEALIVLAATEGDEAATAEVKSVVRRRAWIEKTDGEPSSFTARSSSGRVYLMLENEGNTVSAELGVHESC